MNSVAHSRYFLALSLIAMFYFCAPGRAWPGDIVIYKGEPPAVDDLADILFPESIPAARKSESQDAGGEHKLRFRSIRFDRPAKSGPNNPAAQNAPDNSTKAVASKKPIEDPERNKTEAPDSFGFTIEFGFNSAVVPPAARPFLDRVGELMKSKRATGAKIVIEGHTDAVGSEAYNMALSARRGEAVKQYLAEVHKIDSIRLVTIAKGETELLDPHEPTSSINRRVQFRRGQ